MPRVSDRWIVRVFVTALLVGVTLWAARLGGDLLLGMMVAVTAWYATGVIKVEVAHEVQVIHLQRSLDYAIQTLDSIADGLPHPDIAASDASERLGNDLLLSYGVRCSNSPCELAEGHAGPCQATDRVIREFRT